MDGDRADLDTPPEQAHLRRAEAVARRPLPFAPLRRRGWTVSGQG